MFIKPFTSSVIYSFNLQYCIKIGSTKAYDVRGWLYGFPFDFAMVLKPLDVAGGNVYRIDPIGLGLDIIVITLIIYLLFTLFSDFNIGNKKYVKKSIITIVILSVLLSSSIVTASQYTIGEQTSYSGDLYGSRDIWYVYETFSTTQSFSACTTYAKVRIGWDSGVSGTMTTKLTMPNSNTHSWTETLTSSAQPMTWKIYTATMSCASGNCEMRITSNNQQPEDCYTFASCQYPCSYSGTVHYKYGTDAEQSPSNEDLTFGAYYDSGGGGGGYYYLHMDHTPYVGGTTTPGTGVFGPYPSGESVAIGAYPHSEGGYSFTHWTGSGDGSYGGTSSTHYVVFSDSDIYETANFALQTYTLTITCVPNSGGSISLNPSQPSGGYEAGTVVTCTASENSGYTFSHWSGDLSGTTNPKTITMDADHSITANFESTVTYDLVMSVDPVGGGTTDPPGTTQHNQGDEVEITATPSDHYHFTQWSGGASGTMNPITVTMSGDKYITANFAMDTFTLHVTPDGHGTVNIYAQGVQSPYPYNTEVTLTPNANSGWSFSHWGRDLTGDDNPGYIYMTSDKEVTAVFLQAPTITRFIVTNPTSLSLAKPGNMTLAWTATGATTVNLYLNDVYQGEFNTTVDAKTIYITETTKANIVAIGPGGSAPSQKVTVTVGEGQIVPGGFNYAWLLLLLIPVGLILFNRWLKKKPPFGKGESDYVTVNLSDALKTVTGRKRGRPPKNAPKKNETTQDKARNAAKQAGGAVKKGIGTVVDILKGPKGPPPSNGGDEGYRIHVEE